MRRPVQDIRVFAVQDRRSTVQAKRPWIVRRAIDGCQRSTSFRTKAEADRYRSLLMSAAVAGEAFDPASGEPVSWALAAPTEVRVHQWARRWLAAQWPEWQPRTRASAVEALVRFVLLTASSGSSEELRWYLKRSLPPDSVMDPELEELLEGICPALDDLDARGLAEVDRQLGLKADGSLLAATTASRLRIVARACVRGAVEAGHLPTNPWPEASRTRARRKAARRRTIDLRRLPSPPAMATAIEALRTGKPGSETYRVMTAVAYYAGLRPSEVVMLRRRSVDLCDEGWGNVHVREADISFDEPGEPKTGPRTVPIPPILVMNRPGSDGGSGYWIPTPAGSACWAA